MNFDIVRVKSFFSVQTFNFSSSRMPGFPSQHCSISQSAKHYFRLPESRSRFMLKLKSYSFSSERIAPFSGFCAYLSTTITDGGFIFEMYHIYAYTHLYYASSLSRSCDRRGRIVRFDVDAHAV